MIRRWAGSDLRSNLLWLAVSVLLATGVWYIAVTSADPIDQRSFASIPIRLEVGDATEITSTSTLYAAVTIQGSQATVSSRRSDDIEVRANLSRLGPGTHTVPLEVSVARPDTDSFRRLVWQTQPSQITVELEPRESGSTKIVIELTDSPPIGYKYDPPVPDISEVIVSGAASKVSQVVAVRGDLDLSAVRNPIEVDLRLNAIDADGNRVSDIDLEPQTASISVNVTRRDDVKRVFVRPDVRLETLPEGFSIKSVSNDPSLLFISGAPEQLESISDVLYTEPISLADPEEDFMITVPVQLPIDGLFVMGGDSNITVSIEILADIDSRQVDSIEVGHIGLADDYTVSIVPTSISAIVTGPVVQVDALTVDDIQVIVDLEGYAPGVYDLSPEISIKRGDLSVENVSLSPAELNVEITSPDAQAEEVEAEAPPVSPDS